jgi:hypothetical protein
MFARLLLPILLVFHPPPQNPPAADKNAPVLAINFRWYRDRQSAEKVVVPARGPDLPMIEPTRSIGRTQKPDGTAPERDPNSEKPEARSASLDKIGEEASESSLVNGFTYEVKFRNGGTKQAQTVFWEYQFTETAVSTNTSRRRFVCELKIKPEKEKLVQVFSTLGPGTVINVKNLSKKLGKQFDESVVVDRIEFEDGSVWQRQDWNVEEAKSSPTKRGNQSGICRSF